MLPISRSPCTRTSTLLISLFALVLPISGGAPAGSRSFRVMTFNIQHGVDGTNHYNLQRAIDVIAKLQPDLVGVQELTRNHSKYRCDDQPARITEAVTRATGRQWYHVYVQEWFVAKDRECVERGRGDGPATEGLAFFAPEPLGEVSHKALWNGRLGLAVRAPAFANASIVVTHLASGSQDKSRADRTRQVEQLLSWADTLPAPRIIVGDMNALPNAPELTPLMRAYRDAIADANASGSRRGVRADTTRAGRTGRVDYVFFTPEAGVRLEWVEIVDTSALIGVAASDHHPVLASFVRP